MTRALDFSAFTVAVSDEEIAAFRNEPLTSPAPTTMNAATVGCLAIVTASLLAMVAGIIASVAWAIGSAVNGTTGPAIGVGAIGLIIGGFITFVALASRGPEPRGPWEQRMRLDRFARANGMLFSPSDEAPPFAGLIFSLGERRAVTNRLTSADGRIDIGNFSYSLPGSTGADSNRRDWGYLAIRLERALPHLVLDSTTNNGVLGASGLPGSYARSQVMSLEGDFDTHFRLYAPTGSETDALYIFTPDLMALLIDEAASYDVEIVDDWMFVYSPTPFDSSSDGSAMTYWLLFRIVDTVGAKALSQTDRYLDDFAPDFSSNVVSPTARRLRRPRVSYAGLGSKILTAIGVIVGVVFGVVSLIVLLFAASSLLAR